MSAWDSKWSVTDNAIETVQRLVAQPSPQRIRRHKPYAPPAHLTKDVGTCPCFDCPQRSDCQTECNVFRRYVGTS